MPKKVELHVSQKKYKGETSVVSARLPNELINTIDKYAEKTGRSRNEIILMCLEFATQNIVVSNHEERE